MQNAIEILNVGKRYKLGLINTGSLSQDISIFLSKIRGKENPYHKIGDSNRVIEDQYIWALKDISFNIGYGDTIGIIGKNGAGKSTLLKVLSKITSPTVGEIRLGGRIASLLEVGTGFHPELTGRENIFLNGAILGMRKNEIRAKLDEIIDFSGVSQFIDTPVKRYSSGMYVRLAFAVAAHMEPEILIVDEVLAVGDVEFQKRCIGKMQDVSKEGRTVLFVSHNMAAVRMLCKKSVYLENGTLSAIGNTDEIITSYLSSVFKNSSNKAYVSIREDKEKPFQVLELSINNVYNKTTSHFECDEPVFIDMTCVSHSPMKGLYGFLAITNRMGESVLVSDTFDFMSNVLDSLIRGTYHLRITIPPRTLGHGHYYIGLAFTGLGGGLNTVHDLGNVVSFSLVDNNTKRGNTRPGYFSTLLKWEITNSEYTDETI